jgi:[lysine-biosynthesis-protein LysW]--L-2-aminoadipate ligase
LASFGLVYDRIRWEEKELIKTSKKLNIPLRLIDAKKTVFDPLIEKEKTREIFGDVIIQRCISYFRGLHISAILENNGLSVINKHKTASICGNKLLATLVLTKEGIPNPRTLISFTPESAIEAFAAIGYPAVLKPIVGSWGRLIALVKDSDSAKALIETRKAMRNALYDIFYIQEMVKRPPRDIRVIVIGSEVIAASYRYTPPDDWRTNVSRGGLSKPCPITPELEEISKRASEAVGGGVLAVDCMESPEGLQVHEVNNTAEFHGLSTTTNINIAEKILEYAKSVAEK